jgi:quinol monooxygenase YgiN
MIGIVVTFTVAAENVAALEALVGELAAATRANEPGVIVYRLLRSQTDPGSYRIVELYESEEALDHHLQTEWFVAARPRLPALFATPPTMEQFDVVG